MKRSVFLTLSSIAASALANPIANYAGLLARATTTSSTTTSSTSCAAIPISPTLVAEAVAGCVGVKPTGTNDTRNDIVDKLPCKEITLLFARGTTEDPNLGNLVGPPFVVALDATFGPSNVAVQGVNNYPADPEGFCEGGSPTGSQNLAQLIQQTMTRCPKTKLCVSGYSQGSQVVHNAAKLISSSAAKFINSVVLFGDPDDGQPVGNVPAYKVSTDCHTGDNICQGGDHIYEPHLSYCHDVYTEAAFVKNRSQSSN